MGDYRSPAARHKGDRKSGENVRPNETENFREGKNQNQRIRSP